MRLALQGRRRCRGAGGALAATAGSRRRGGGTVAGCTPRPHPAFPPPARSPRQSRRGPAGWQPPRAQQPTPSAAAGMAGSRGSRAGRAQAELRGAAQGRGRRLPPGRLRPRCLAVAAWQCRGRRAHLEVAPARPRPAQHAAPPPAGGPTPAAGGCRGLQMQVGAGHARRGRARQRLPLLHQTGQRAISPRLTPRGTCVAHPPPRTPPARRRPAAARALPRCAPAWRRPPPPPAAS